MEMREKILETKSSMLAKQNCDWYVFNKNLRPNLKKTDIVVFINLWDLLDLKYLIFDSNLHFILVEFKIRSLNNIEIVKVDWLKFFIKNFYNLIFGKSGKLEKEICKLCEKSYLEYNFLLWFGLLALRFYWLLI